MNKILIAVDDTKESLAVVETLNRILGDCQNNGWFPEPSSCSMSKNWRGDPS